MFNLFCLFLVVALTLCALLFVDLEGGEVVDVQNIKHIAENKRLIGEVVEETVEDWSTQKELFYKQTGIKEPSQHFHQLQEGNDNLELVEANHNFGNEGENNTREYGEEENSEGLEDDDFGVELEQELLCAANFDDLED